MAGNKETMEIDDKPFVCGVCEGFYGRPWTSRQRKELFQRMKRMGMNTYLYAPKDDYKHRINWRLLYNQDECNELKEIISCATQCGINFVYAISPGLDIEYSRRADVDILKNKLLQVQGLGCNSWALLFDDIDIDMTPRDEVLFSSVAHAQCSVTNDVITCLKSPQSVLFCPTEYCATRAIPDVLSSDYLLTLGRLLPAMVDILWTGPRVVPRTISVESLKDVRKVLSRAPLIWENLHANDYDQTRLCLGPYVGRSTELRGHVRGVLTNPNCEFEMNFVAMHTLAQWARNAIDTYPEASAQSVVGGGDEPPDVDMEGEERLPYEPAQALRRATQDWLSILQLPTSAEGEFAVVNHPPTAADDAADVTAPVVDEPEKDADKEDVDMEPLPSNSRTRVEPARDGEVARARMEARALAEEELRAEELVTLCELFYSPWEYGPCAQNILRKANWLLSNASRLQDNHDPLAKMTDDVKEWYENAAVFYDLYKDVAILADKVLKIPNRCVLYELYPYVTELRSVLSLLNSYIKWHGMGKPNKEPFNGKDPEPWLYRGGLQAEIRRMLPFEGETDMYPAPRPDPKETQVFAIRPYLPSDKLDVYNVCKQTCDDGSDGSHIYPDHSELMADECIGGMLSICPETCFVLEDDHGVCGYVACAADVKKYQKRLADEWLVEMKKKYAKPSAAKSLTGSEEAIMSFYTGVSPIPEQLFRSHPSYLQLAVISRRLSQIGTSRRLLDCALKVLKSHASPGVHTVINAQNSKLLAFHIKVTSKFFYIYPEGRFKVLGFVDITDDLAPANLMVLAHPL